MNNDFETVPVGTLAKLNEVETEHDKLLEEYYALAAHVEELNAQASTLDESTNSDVLHNLLQTLADGPETSLARLIAEKQAEALEIAKAKALSRDQVYTAHWLHSMLTELRRQAEGGE